MKKRILSMPRSLDLEQNNNFSHPHIDIGDCWMKLKKIKMLVSTSGYIAFAKDDQNNTNKEVERSWWHIWNYRTTKKKGKLLVYIAKEIQRFEERILYFGFDFFFLNISCIGLPCHHMRDIL